MGEQQDVRALDYLYEVGLLKRYKRTGWLVAGVAAPESIAVNGESVESGYDEESRTVLVPLRETDGALDVEILR
jgi:DNA-binding GntR family transcriptional regulator